MSHAQQENVAHGSLIFLKSLYLLKLNISKWKLKIKTLVQINSSNIRNTIFCQLASLGTGVLRSRQNLGHCPKATKLMSVANLMFTYPLTNVLIRRCEVIIERSLCQISFHNSSLAGCDKTLPDVIKRCVWDNWEIFTRKKITHEGESVVSRKVGAPKTSWFCFFFFSLWGHFNCNSKTPQMYLNLRDILSKTEVKPKNFSFQPNYWNVTDKQSFQEFS